MKWIIFRRQVLGRSLSGPVHTNEIVNINDETKLAKWRANKYFRVVILSRTETWNEVVGQIQSIFIILYHTASVSRIFCRSWQRQLSSWKPDLKGKTRIASRFIFGQSFLGVSVVSIQTSGSNVSIISVSAVHLSSHSYRSNSVYFDAVTLGTPLYFRNQKIEYFCYMQKPPRLFINDLYFFKSSSVAFMTDRHRWQIFVASSNIHFWNFSLCFEACKMDGIMQQVKHGQIIIGLLTQHFLPLVASICMAV